jgi:hypothetical protein
MGAYPPVKTRDFVRSTAPCFPPCRPEAKARRRRRNRRRCKTPARETCLSPVAAGRTCRAVWGAPAVPVPIAHAVAPAATVAVLARLAFSPSEYLGSKDHAVECPWTCSVVPSFDMALKANLFRKIEKATAAFAGACFCELCLGVNVPDQAARTTSGSACKNTPFAESWQPALRGLAEHTH